MSKNAAKKKKIAKKTTSERTIKARPIPIPAVVRTRLERTLLSLGGSKVIWQDSDPQVALIAAQGQLFPQSVELRPGPPHYCHANAADLWARTPDRYKLVTGYALSDDTWWDHSWVIEGKTLLETTGRFERYFGVALVPFLAHKFWFDNVYVPACRNGAPPDIWKHRPGLVDIAQQILRLPPEEVFRQVHANEELLCACPSSYRSAT